MWVAPSMVEIQIHGPSLRMSNYNPLQLVQKNSQPLHLRIPCNDESVKFLGEKLLVLFLDFFNKIKKVVRIKKR
jgi:hypothetical protein